MFESARIISKGNGESSYFDPLHEVGKRIYEATLLHDMVRLAMERAEWDRVVIRLDALREMLDEARELHERAVGQ